MNTISQTKTFFEVSSKCIPKQLQKLYAFGFQALSIQPIRSLNSNARCTVRNQHTAESKIYRLVSNKRFVEHIPKILKALQLLKKDDVVIIDFSNFKNGKQILMFAVQTRKGRAIPIYFEEITYPIQKGSQNLFIWNAMKNFLKLVDMKVRFVFDRGFAIPFLVKKLVKHKIIFYIRIKKRKSTYPTCGKRAAENLHFKDTDVWIYENNLRVVRTDRRKEVKEPWYIVTNDFVSSRKEIISVYYFRFEVEELFKDAKHFFRMEFLRIRKPETLIVVLWFVILGIWLSWFLHQTLGKGKRCAKRKKNTYSVSISQFWLERLMLDMRQSIIPKPAPRAP